MHVVQHKSITHLLFPHTCVAFPWAQDNGGGFKDDEEAWGAMYDGLGSIMCGSHMPLVRSGVMRFMHKSGHVEDVECVACG